MAEAKPNLGKEALQMQPNVRIQHNKQIWTKHIQRIECYFHVCLHGKHHRAQHLYRTTNTFCNTGCKCSPPEAISQQTEDAVNPMNAKIFNPDDTFGFKSASLARKYSVIFSA